jgi:uncharacterized protein YsxB (DUF464 family)
MIQVKVRSDSVTVTGHARHAPPGQDIVCAAVSALTQTLAASMQALTDTKLHTDITTGHDARFFMSWSAPEDKASLLVDAFFIGISGVATAYPECVKFI